MEIRYFGHSFFSISSNNTTVVVDPFINRSSLDSEFSTLLEAPCTEKELKGVTLILITHEHFDHFDRKAVEYIASRDNSCVVSHESVLNRLSLPKNLVRAISAGDKATIRNTKIEAIAVHHPNSFYPLSYLISMDGREVFHMGDTDLTESFCEVHPDVAMLPIGGTTTMDIIDAVRATKLMKPSYAIPMHYNTFELIKAEPSEFRQRIEKSILKTKPVILQPGERFIL